MERMITGKEIILIGRRLKNLRVKLGLTQQEFADKLFWDVSTYQKIESGKTLMTLDKALQLHREYHVDLNYFVAGESLDYEDTITDMLVNSSKQDCARIMIRFLEYLIRIIKMSIKKN